MASAMRDVVALLDRRQRRSFAVTQVWVVVAAFVEVAGIASIAPLVAAISAPEAELSSYGLDWISDVTGVTERRGLLMLLSVIVLALTLLAALVSASASWQTARFSERLGASLASRLFATYLERDWLFHVRHHSSELVQRVAIESMRVTTSVVRPLLQAIARGTVGLFVMIGLLAYEPVLTLGILLLLAAVYLTLFGTVRRRTQHNGRRISSHSEKRFQLMDESLGGIREVLLRGNARFHRERFDAESDGMARARAQNEVLAQLPRYVMDTVLVLILVGSLVWTTRDGQSLVSSLPTLAVFGVAGLKLTPALTAVYSAVATISGNRAALESVLTDARPRGASAGSSVDALPISRTVELRDVSFTYPADTDIAPTLERVSITIPAGSVVGLVGRSGAGKSTVLDLLTGLLTPSAGEVLVDGEPLTRDTLRQWQESIAYVPQHVFLTDASITHNIALGIDEHEIDLARVREALHVAALSEVVASLPDGLATKVGEAGVRLSGGQRQRLGIARAVYRADAALIILDEATSALDVATEETVLRRLRASRPDQAVVVVTHRLSSLRASDTVHVLAEGLIVACGPFDDVIAEHPHLVPGESR